MSFWYIRIKMVSVCLIPSVFFFFIEAPPNFPYALGEHEHTAGYDATCTAICMAKMMAYIGINK